MAELAHAARSEEWKKVEVSRPLEAVFCCECGPSRAVRLGLGQWTLKPSSHAGFGLAMPNPAPYVRRSSGNFDFACRRSSMLVTTSIPVARALLCHIA
jgi:hypothetical protein